MKLANEKYTPGNINEMTLISWHNLEPFLISKYKERKCPSTVLGGKNKTKWFLHKGA